MGARELGVEKPQTICFDDTVEWMEDALEDYLLAESREEEWWNDLQRDIDEIHSLISENELSEPWSRGRTSSPNKDEYRKEGLDENNNENAQAYSKLNKLEPNPTYRLPELSPRALRRKGESRSSLDYSGEGERSLKGGRNFPNRPCRSSIRFRPLQRCSTPQSLPRCRGDDWRVKVSNFPIRFL